MQVKKSPYLDARLSDICISTSAAPTYLPAYHFKNLDENGNVKEFHLIDGGVAANNPVRPFSKLISFFKMDKASLHFKFRPQKAVSSRPPMLTINVLGL